MEKQDGWASEMGYMWSMLGTAIGFANLLGFGSQCYRNGGGAFLLPFFVALFVLGIPMLILEGIVGQSTRLPLVSAYGKFIGRRGKFLGWLAVIAVATISAFYLVLTGEAVAYSYFALTDAIPADTKTFFSHDFLGETGNLADFGSLSWPLFASTLLVGLFGWYVIHRNIQSGIEKWCSFFLPLLAVMTALFVGVVCFLPGAWTGFYHYLAPDFAKLLDFALWRDVFGQLFFSLSLGLGIVVGYSRHTQQKTNMRKAMLQVALADFMISFVAGFVIFGCIGFMANGRSEQFQQIVETTSVFEIGYVIFPMIIDQFGPMLSRIVGCLFFFSLFIAGITGVFSIIESIAGNIQVEFNKNRSQAVSIAMGITCLLAIPFCMGNGTALIDALAPMVLGNNMLIGGIAQIVVFLYLVKKTRDHEVWFEGTGRHWSFMSLKYAGLFVLVLCLAASFRGEWASGFGLPEMVRWGWLAGAALLATILSRAAKKA